MLQRSAAAVKTREGNRIRCSAEDLMDIIVDSGARDPLDMAVQPHVIPSGTPMAPVAARDGHYMPIRRTTASTAAAGVTLTVVDASPFGTGDVIAVFTTTGPDIATTISAAATIAGLSDAANELYLGVTLVGVVTGVWIEVLENGHVAFLADPNDYDAVVLYDPVQNVSDPPAVTAIDVPAVGAFGGRLEAVAANGPSAAGPDDLLEYAMRQFSWVPSEPGA